MTKPPVPASQTEHCQTVLYITTYFFQTLQLFKVQIIELQQQERDIYVSELRKFERICLKITKLRLDILYFERCINLRIRPKFLMFKPPKLKAYNKTDNIKAEILQNQIGILQKELQTTCDLYRKLKSKIQNKLSFLEYTILIRSQQLIDNCSLRALHLF